VPGLIPIEMRIKKTIEIGKIEKVADLPPKGTDIDPFLVRIQIQGTILKKLLAEVNQHSKTESDNINGEEKNMDFSLFENKSD
jgi:hypothetical protein